GRAEGRDRVTLMCGRYAASARPEDLVEEFEVESDQTSVVRDLEGSGAGAERGSEDAPEGTGPVPWRPRFNLAPTDSAPVVLTRRPRGEPDAEPVRQLRMLRWGLVPSWSKNAGGGARMINARAETLLETAAYKRTALVRRCLVPADGWYEWQASPSALDAKGKPRKQPFFVHRQDAQRLAFAGLYEFWRDRTLADEDPAAWLVTYTIVTTAAEPGLDRLHERQPVVLDPDHWARWLDPDLNDPAAILGLLESPGPGRFEAYPVTPQVSSVRNDGPELLQP